MYYSYSTDGFYHPILNAGQIPPDAIKLTAEEYSTLKEGKAVNKGVTKGDNGRPVLADLPVPAPTSVSLCAKIDEAADTARRAVAGDPLRAVEYDRAATEAHAYVSGGYQGAVPPMVAAWAIKGRTAQQAADDILREAAQHNGALVQLRIVRLQAKELIRQAMADGNVELAEDIAAETIASIEAAVAGIGNNA